MARKRAKPRRTSARGLSWYTDPAFRPFALTLGQLALSWNNLQETLSMLFCRIMPGDIDNQYLAIWNELKFDRAQRDVLLGAVKSDYQGARPPKFAKDIIWLCGQADKVEDARNNAIHSPLWLDVLGNKKVILPRTSLGNKRAQKLSGKNLLEEFRWCRDYSILLSVFASAIDAALSDLELSWPERPQQPNRGDPKKKRPLPQARKAKRPLPPRSSQA